MTEVTRYARLTESFHLTQVLNAYMAKRLDLLQECQEKDKDEYDDLYEQRKIAMITMVNDAIDHTIEMDHLYE
jgi:hypothetical protein